MNIVQYEWVSGDKILIRKFYLLQTLVILGLHKRIQQNKNNKNNYQDEPFEKEEADSEKENIVPVSTKNSNRQNLQKKCSIDILHLNTFNRQHGDPP